MKYIIVTFLSLSLGAYCHAQVVQGELLGQWSDPSLIGSSTFNNTYNEIWGYAAGGHEYAIIGSTFGIHIIDVTEPAELFEAFRIPGSRQGAGIIHRDHHDYRGYLYTISDEVAGNRLQIIDLNMLPDTAMVVYDSDQAISRAHNIFIDTAAARLYACIARGGDGLPTFEPMRIYDISEPLDPILLRSYSQIEGRSFGQVHDGWVRNDTAFLNLGPTGMILADFSDIDNPRVLSSLSPSDYPQSGYNHSGWPLDDLSYYYFADEDWGRELKVLDASDPEDIRVVHTFGAGSDDPNSIPHNQVVHEDLLYVSYYYDGLQVYDLADPSRPERVMEYPTSQIAPRPSYEGAWGVYPFLPSGNILVSDMQEGLFVIEAWSGQNTNTEEQANREKLVYTNPSDGLIQFSTSIQKMQLMNLQGKLIYSEDQTGSMIDLRDMELPNGLYWAQIRYESGQSFVPIVISSMD